MSLKDRLLDKNQIFNPEQEKEIITAVKDKVKNDKDFLNPFSLNRAEYKDKLFMLINSEIYRRFPLLEFEVSQDFLEYAISEIFGLGVLEKYLSDKKVTDIFIQDREMLVISNGEKKYLGEVFDSIDEVLLIIDRIKASSGKTVDQRMPFLNTELYDGSRCSIVIPPVSDRIYISIRVFNCLDFELQDLLELGMFNNKIFNVLKGLIQDKKNILIAGSMGSGKTTLLNTLAKLIPKSEIINIIQDLPEIKLSSHPYVRMLTTRPKSREADNEISQDRLVYETLRMKADRIIVGEVRDCMAAYQMLQALNTGHRGSFSTIHSDSAYDGLLRLEMLAMEYKSNLSSSVIKKIVSRAIDTVLFLECEKDENLNIKNRKISEIVLVDKNLNEAGDYKLSCL
ncbi:MAG TPA: ATPase, T2SS/T4P/T4SS family [Methanosarcinales archaeon]|nr:ATPase, T2SS/T4P/T4SS family [Methanosarcinales archaeon]